MEGCLVRGPFALGESSILKMGTKVYGATTVGPFCKVGRRRLITLYYLVIQVKAMRVFG